MKRAYLFATAGAAIVFGSLFGALALRPPAPRLIWNASASAPLGLYRVRPGAAPAVGDLVAIMPPARVSAYLEARGYVPKGVPLLKRVAALPGARVCRSGAFVTVDGLGIARAMPSDHRGRPLPVWLGCRVVGPHEIFLISAAPASLDSRYFGPLPVAGLLGSAEPLLTRTAPGAPLRWRRGAAQASSPTAQE